MSENERIIRTTHRQMIRDFGSYAQVEAEELAFGMEDDAVLISLISDERELVLHAKIPSEDVAAVIEQLQAFLAGTFEGEE